MLHRDKYFNLITKGKKIVGKGDHVCILVVIAGFLKHIVNTKQKFKAFPNSQITAVNSTLISILCSVVSTPFSITLNKVTAILTNKCFFLVSL